MLIALGQMNIGKIVIAILNGLKYRGKERTPNLRPVKNPVPTTFDPKRSHTNASNR